MIYLIDEKKDRQKDYFWDEPKFQKYKSVLSPVYTKDELDAVRLKMFSSNDVILFHDSFFDDPRNRHEKNIDEIRQRLKERSEKNPVVFFSGSIGYKTIDKNSASLPVSVLYQNLESFIKKYFENQDEPELRYLGFGENYRREEIAQIKNDIWKVLYKYSNIQELPDLEILDDKTKELSKIINGEIPFEKFVNKKTVIGYFKSEISMAIERYNHG